jgi:hypothetical protein
MFVALCATAIVSLRYASPEWRTIVLSIMLIVFCAAAIIALVERGPRQAFAIGCAVSMLVYGITLLVMWRSESNPSTAQLVTTYTLAPLYRSIAEIRFLDFATGQYVNESEYQKAQRSTGSARITLNEMPRRETFMMIGHGWWAILLGLCGGWFARLIYLRRERAEGTLAAGRS